MRFTLRKTEFSIRKGSKTYKNQKVEKIIGYEKGKIESKFKKSSSMKLNIAEMDRGKIPTRNSYEIPSRSTSLSI